MSDYRELHLRSAFSFLRGAASPESLADRAGELGLTAAALCDRNGFYGSVRFHQRAKENAFQAIVGTELTMEDGSVLPVLAKTRAGYRALSMLLTSAQFRSPKGECAVRWAELEPLVGEVAFLTGDEEGALDRAWRRGGRGEMGQAMDKMLRYLPPRDLYVEVQRHALREGEALIRAKADLAEHHGLPLLATGGVVYAAREDRPVLDLFTCLRHHTTLDAAGRLLSTNGERYLHSAQQMESLFRDHPEAIRNTRRLAESIDFSLENLGYEFPRYDVSTGHSMDSYLAEVVWQGAKDRYRSKLSRKVRAQITRELELITRLGFSGYFLIVWDLVAYCRAQDILVQGRGSAANSAVCYCLGITPVDPVGAKLLFERFLSEGRKSWPDIDLDLPSGERREQVIQEVYRRYGRRGAAMTANVITYRRRSAVREIGKVLELPEEIIARFCELYGGGSQHALEFHEQASLAGLSMQHPRAEAFATLLEKIKGLPRHLGQHSGGMIICQGALDSIVPLENASMPGRTVVQWDKDDCEDMGIVKVDLLGLGMMAVLQDSLRIAESRGRPIDLAHLPKDDATTYDLMCSAETIGVFQIESRAQINTLRRMQPRRFYDVVIEVAIVRPGPIAGGLAHPYLERRAGREAIDYIDEKLRPTLERTLGVPMFQEQVLKMAMVMADFSGAEAEELRRALSFHRSHERMQQVEIKLRAALRERQVAEETVEKIVKAIGSFALYGFPESHAISFALLAYASAYLKVHRAAEFYASLLNHQPMGFYSAATLVQEGRRRGLRFLPPCVVESDWFCEVIDDDTIRLGLVSIRGLRSDEVEKMQTTRQIASFQSLLDFRNRTSFDSAAMRKLASSGALRALEGAETRRRALWATAAPVLRQGDLFATALVAEPEDSFQPPDMSYVERVQADYDTMGLTTGRHPMALVRAHLSSDILSAARLMDAAQGAMVSVAGSAICRQQPSTAKGVVFITLEDETGVCNVIVYSKIFEQDRLVIVSEPFLLVDGSVQREGNGTVHLIADRIRPLALDTSLPTAGSHDFH